MLQGSLFPSENGVLNYITVTCQLCLSAPTDTTDCGCWSPESRVTRSIHCRGCTVLQLMSQSQQSTRPIPKSWFVLQSCWNVCPTKACRYSVDEPLTVMLRRRGGAGRKRLNGFVCCFHLSEACPSASTFTSTPCG